MQASLVVEITAGSYQFESSLFAPAGHGRKSLLLSLAEPLYNSGPNFPVSGPIDEFLRAPVRADIRGPGNRFSLSKRTHHQQRVVIQHYQ